MSSEQLGGVLAQRYEVEARIGAGGMGEVYRAHDRTLARRVAIKRLAPSLAGEPRHRDRLLQEARSAARVNHQGLAALYDVLEHEGQFVLVKPDPGSFQFEGFQRPAKGVVVLTEKMKASVVEGTPSKYDVVVTGELDGLAISGRLDPEIIIDDDLSN